MLIERGQMLKNAIKAEEITQEEFASRIGVSVNTLRSAICRNDFSDFLTKKISDYFGSDWSFLQKEVTGWRHKSNV